MLTILLPTKGKKLNVKKTKKTHSMALFIRLIIRLFQLIFSVGIVFFSRNKSANSIFEPAYQHSRTGPMSPSLSVSDMPFWPSPPALCSVFASHSVLQFLDTTLHEFH
jgi:hypothetical protein